MQDKRALTESELKNGVDRLAQESRREQPAAGEMDREAGMRRQELLRHNEDLLRVTTQLEALRQTYESLFHDAPMGYVVFGEDGMIKIANRTFCKMVGMGGVGIGHGDSQGGRRAICFTDFIPSDRREAFYSMIRRVISAAEPEAMETRLHGGNGSLAVSVSVNLLRADAYDSLGRRIWGEDRLVRCAICDITEYKRRQNELRHSSLHDPLTELPNRRYYDLWLDELDAENTLPLAVIMIDLDGLKIINDSLGHASGDKAIVMMGRILRRMSLRRFLPARIGGDEFSVICPNTTFDEAAEFVAKVQKFLLGYLADGAPLSMSAGIAVKSEPDVDIRHVIVEAEDRMYTKKLHKCATTKGGLIEAIKEVLFSREPLLRAHVERVSRLLADFGAWLLLPEKTQAFLKELGILHDIGMIAATDAVPHKMAGSDQGETARKNVMRHPEIGCRIIRSAPDMANMANAVLYHHEAWDGSGYPRSISGAQIPYESRLLALVGAYDRLRYGYEPGDRGGTPAEIERELAKKAGVQFDPELTEQFLAYLRAKGGS